MVTNNERKTDGEIRKRKNPFIKRFLIVITAMVLLLSFTCIVFGQSSETTIDLKTTQTTRPFRASGKIGSSIATEQRYGNGIRKAMKDTIVSMPNKSVENHILETEYILPEQVLEQGAGTPSDPFSVNVYAASGRNDLSNSDASLSVKLTLCVKYQFITSKNKTYVKLIKAAGKLQSLTGHTGSSQGSGVSIVSNNYTVNTVGPNTKGENVSYYYYGKCNNKPSKWTFTNTKWPAVGYAKGEVGCNQTVTLKRGNKEWKLSLVNNIG